ncbi:MAG: PQQ-binding-like beta-propeller repeat protein, partial [Gimesia sp.]
LSLSDNKQPIDFKAAISQDALAVTDASGLLQLLDPKTAQQKAKIQLPSPANNDLWISEGLLFVESKQNLSCFNIKTGLEKIWDLKLPDSSLSGSPSIINKNLLLSLQDGSLLSIDTKTGKIQTKTKTPLPTSGSIVNLNNLILVPTVDGSFYRIDQVLQQKGQASL